MKKGLSTVVSALLLVLLVIVATTVVWRTVNGIVKDKTSGVTSCFDVSFSDKVFFNQDYTCYDFDKNETRFSIGIGDIDVESVLVSISYAGTSKSFTLTKEDQTLSGLVTYPLRESLVSMPGKNSGKTYIATGINAQPDWIKISPYVEGKQCDVSDTIYEPEDCKLFD